MPGNQAALNPEVTATLDDMLDTIEVSNALETLVQDVLLAAPYKDRKGEVSTEHAFDYDGCIGNNQDEKKTPEKIVEAEADFWAYVKRIMHAETKGLPKDRRCVSIATARQSKEDDDYCTEHNNSTSCFPLYPYIADYLDAEIDKFLLADAKKQLPTGTSFDRAMNPEYEGEHESWYFDESKITLIYAKVHRSALCNPNGLALFTFYDDRKDILDGLHAFFTGNRDLLPHNLVLNLCLHVQGSGVVYSYNAIFGIQNSTSLGIDYRYKQTATTVGAYIHSFATTEEDSLGNVYRIPIGISEIEALKLGAWVYNLRTPPSAEEEVEEVEEVESAERQLQPRIGQMIFESPNEVDDALGVIEADQKVI
jgi:hypothetical protein